MSDLWRAPSAYLLSYCMRSNLLTHQAIACGTDLLVSDRGCVHLGRGSSKVIEGENVTMYTCAVRERRECGVGLCTSRASQAVVGYEYGSWK